MVPATPPSDLIDYVIFYRPQLSNGSFGEWVRAATVTRLSNGVHVLRMRRGVYEYRVEAEYAEGAVRLEEGVLEARIGKEC